MNQLFLSPAEIARKTVESSRSKASLRVGQTVLLGFLAGAFIALAAQGPNMAAYNLLSSPDTFGIGKLAAGFVFSAGLILVILCGGELFTGNTLIAMGVLSSRVSVREMLRNWIVVYICNLIGGMTVAFLIVHSGQLSASGSELAGMTIKIAVGKVSLPFGSAIILGLLCNWLVCLAVWMSTAAKDVGGKILGIFFPIMLFVTSGFEHSVANMYYIPAGILAKSVQAYADAAAGLGVTADQMSSLNWHSMWINNLIPVTAGNILGGCVFVALLYWLIYLKPEKAPQPIPQKAEAQAER